MAPNLKAIKAIAYDLDGVATDGSIIPAVLRRDSALGR